MQDVSSLSLDIEDLGTVFFDCPIQNLRFIQLEASDNELRFQMVFTLVSEALTSKGFDFDELVSSPILLDELNRRLAYLGYQVEISEVDESSVHYCKISPHSQHLSARFLMNPFHPFNLLSQMDPPVASFLDLFVQPKYLPLITGKWADSHLFNLTSCTPPYQSSDDDE